jgi:hypothetical protein
LADVRATRCNLANVEARRATASRVSIASCRLTGLAFPEATLRDVTVGDSRADFASFAFARLHARGVSDGTCRHAVNA